MSDQIEKLSSRLRDFLQRTAALCLSIQQHEGAPKELAETADELGEQAAQLYEELKETESE